MKDKSIESKFIQTLNSEVKRYNQISGFPELPILEALDESKVTEIRDSVVTGKIQADELRQRCHDLDRLINSYESGEFE